MRSLIAFFLVLMTAAPAWAADGEVVQPWWDEEAAAWLGGLVGGSVGLLGAVYGSMAGLGIAPRFILYSTLVLACAGVSVLLAGLIALGTGQPYHVYFLPLVIGGVLAVVCGINYPIIKRRIEQMEMHDRAEFDS